MIERIEIKGTEDTPEILLDKEENHFLIMGRSLPSNSTEFFAPIRSWFREYVASPNVETILIFKMEYFNSSTARAFIEIFHELEKLLEKRLQVKVLWYHQEGDQLIEEKGSELQSIVDVPFELVVV
jgi:SiaC family regulatory phosphoprotein